MTKEEKIIKQLPSGYKDGFHICCRICKVGGKNITLHIDFPNRIIEFHCSNCNNYIKYSLSNEV